MFEYRWVTLVASAKMTLLEDFAAIAQALSAPARLALLEQLAQGEQSVEALARKTGTSVANCSQHLQHLRQSALVRARRDGRRIYYALADDLALELMDLIARIAERNNARVRQLLRDIGGGEVLEPLTRDQLAKRLASGEVTLLDVRPEDEFAMGHIPGATHIRPEDIDNLSSALQAEGEVIAYCRGPYCLYARQAEAALRKAGVPARRVAGGMPEWRAEGRPVSEGKVA